MTTLERSRPRRVASISKKAPLADHRLTDAGLRSKVSEKLFDATSGLHFKTIITGSQLIINY